MPVIKELHDVIARLGELPEDRQQAAAVMLLDFLEEDEEIVLTPEQIAEMERCLEDEDFATDDEVRAVFDRICTRGRPTSPS
jgi:hypothetical protein